MKQIILNTKFYPATLGRKDVIDIVKSIFSNRLNFLISNKNIKKKNILFIEDFSQKNYIENILKFKKNNNKIIILLTEYFTNKNFNSLNHFKKLNNLEFLLLFFYSKTLRIFYSEKIFILILSLIYFINFFLFSINKLFFLFFLVLIYFLTKYFFKNHLIHLFEEFDKILFFRKRYLELKKALQFADLILCIDENVFNSLKKNNSNLYKKYKNKLFFLNPFESIKRKKLFNKGKNFVGFVGFVTSYRKKILKEYFNFKFSKKSLFFNKSKNSRYKIILPSGEKNSYVSSGSLIFCYNKNSIPLVFSEKKRANKNYNFIFNSKSLKTYKKNYNRILKSENTKILKMRKLAFKHNKLVFNKIINYFY